MSRGLMRTIVQCMPEIVHMVVSCLMSAATDQCMQILVNSTHPIMNMDSSISQRSTKVEKSRHIVAVTKYQQFIKKRL